MRGEARSLVRECTGGLDALVGMAYRGEKRRTDVIRFKVTAIEQMLEERKPELPLAIYQNIRRIIDKGAEGMDHNTLSLLCRDLKCLPTDIVEFV